MIFRVLSLFPEFFDSPLRSSILKRCQEKGIIEVKINQIRDFSLDKNRKVDDTVYGGGAGMLMRPDVVSACIRSAKEEFPDGKIIFFTPTGERFSQKLVEQHADDPSPKILLCGNYEGIDARVINTMVDEKISLGDFILTGGEFAAVCYIDAITRLLPGAIGKKESHQRESFSEELFRLGEYPQYTRPETWEGFRVPEILLSGNHKEIEEWQWNNLDGLSFREQEILGIRRKYFSPKKPWKSKNLFLQTPTTDVIETWVKWMNDLEITEFMIQNPPFSYSEEEEYFEWTQHTMHGLFLSIFDKKTKKPIGSTNLILSEQDDLKATFGIVIGEKEYWGRGYGSECTREMCKIGFGHLRLEKISLTVFPKNLPAIHVYEKIGFKKVGLMKNHVFKNGKREDLFLYELLKEEFLQKRG
jgi:tRNA (guanine37-N1)-methyltransferase